MNKTIVIAAYLWVGITPLLSLAGQSFSEKLSDKYFIVLDSWVNRGGKVEEYHRDVVETCGKLVMTTADGAEAVAFTTIKKEEFDFRVAVCTKTTVHRVRHQPEFDDDALVKVVCEGTNILIHQLCRRSGLR